MKKTIYSILGLLIVALTLNSCVKDTDYDTPQINCEEPNLTNAEMSSIQNAKEAYFANNDMAEFASLEDAPVYLTGYVTNSDETGNFYKELFIQDKAENPQHAIKVIIDMNSLYAQFSKGMKIYVRLNGLAIDKSHGEYVIGKPNGSGVENISENLAKEAVIRTCEIAEIKPKLISANAIDNNDLGLYVQLDHMQFDHSVVGKPYVNPYDSYDSYRALVSCESSGSIPLETSTFASFKDQIVEPGQGSISGVLTRNYGDDFYVIKINSPEDVVFDGNRCDPLFQDGFSNGFDQWTTYSVTGDQEWTIDPQYGNPGSCAKMSGYSGGSNANEDWLISKAIDLTGVSAATLTFQTARNYNGPDMVVKMTTDYDGASNPNDFTWTDLPATLSDGSWSWTDSGAIDLSAAVGQNVYIAFVYTSTSSSSATYEVDNIKIVE